MPVMKRPIRQHEIFDPAIHIERRVSGERRKPWQRADQNDRRFGNDRRKKGVKARHAFYVKP